MQRKRTWIVCGSLSILAAACACAGLYTSGDIQTGDHAEDPFGAWKLKCVSPDGKPRECVVTIFREGAVLGGHYTVDGVTRPAKKVVLDQGVLNVEVDGKFAGQVYGLTYKGTPRGDALRGWARWSYGWASGSFPFDGERIDQQVASTP